MEYVRDSQNKIIGRIDDEHSGNIIARDANGQIIGRYDKGMNATIDRSGRKLYNGNMVETLIHNNANK